MKRLYLYISTERRNSLFLNEIINGITTIKESVPTNKSLNAISVRSVSLKQNSSNENMFEAEVNECLHDLETDDAEIIDLKHLQEAEDQLPDDEFIANDFFKLADYLHSFADLYCDHITTYLTILWCVEAYAPCPSEVIEFYAALLRMQTWHNGTLNVITNNSEVIEDWKELLTFNVTPCTSSVIQHDLSYFWRGSLAFSVEGRSGQVFYPEVMLSSVQKSFDPFYTIGKREVMNSYVLPICEVFTEVELGSIPWAYIQKGSLCKLETFHSISQEQKTSISEIIKTLTSSRGTGTLIRIRYSTSEPPVLEELESNKTENWKQTIAEGNFDTMLSYNFKGSHDCLVLVILPEWANEEAVYCLALQDPCSFSEDIVNLVMRESLKSQEIESPDRDKIMNLLQDTGEISEIQMAAFSHLLLNLPTLISNKLSKSGQDIKTLPDEVKLAMERCGAKQIEKLLFIDLPPIQILSLDQFLPAEISVEKELWPEYRALEKAEEAAKNSLTRRPSGELLCGLPPPISSDSIVTLDANQFLKYFKSNGDPVEPILSKKFQHGPLSCNIVKSSMSVVDAKQINWPDAAHLRHHGIYYNSNNEQEKFELCCNHYRDRHIRSDLASTCTIFQNKEHNTIIPNRKRKLSRKISPDKSSRKIVLPRPKFKELHDDSTSVKSTSSFGVKSNASSIIKGTMADRIQRRSPRKRKKDDMMKPSDLLKPKHLSSSQSKKLNQNRQEKKPPKPADLSDLHKMKLRNVILSCLEDEGIDVKHKLFKLCFKKMFAVCKPFALDVIGHGSTTKNFETVAKSHVKQVVQFEKRKNK